MKIRILIGAGGLALAGLAGLGWGVYGMWREAAALKQEKALLQVRADETAALREEARRLAALSPGESERARLRAAAADAARLEEEARALRTEAEKRRQRANVTSADAVPQATPPREDKPFRPLTTFANAGRATPQAVTETALWAAIGGDLDTLSELIWLSPACQTMLNDFLASLPWSGRAAYPTPQKFVAAMTAVDITALGAKIADQPVTETDTFSSVTLTLRVSEERTRMAALAALRTGSQWQLVVPDAVVEGYMARIKAGARSE